MNSFVSAFLSRNLIDHRGGYRRGVLHQFDVLRQFDELSRSEIDKHVCVEAARILNHARDCAPFYRERIPQEITVANVFDVLSQIPILTKQDVQQSLNELCVDGAYLFGSIVHGPFREESDIDCALLLRAGGWIDHVGRLWLTGELSESVGRTVDIGIISSANLVYAMQAVSKESLLFAHDKTVVETTVMYIYSLCTTLREERYEVEKSYECR